MKKISAALVLNLITFTNAFACDGINGGFRSVFTDTCITTYQQWLVEAWVWSLVILIPISVLVLSAAGILYMVSEGDSNRISLAKKLILGVVSGIGLLILARVFLVGIVGIDEQQYEGDPILEQVTPEKVGPFETRPEKSERFDYDN